jgi:hypothetical protein
MQLFLSNTNASLAEESDGPDKLEKLRVPRAIKVHPKLALLFMRGVPVREAYMMFFDLMLEYETVLEKAIDPLDEFISAAVMSDGNQGGAAPKLARGWQRMDPGSSPELEEWYQNLLDQAAPEPATDTPIDGAPGPNETDGGTLAKLADAIVAARGENPGPGRIEETRDKYNRYEIELLCGVTGKAGPPELWKDMTEAHLPDFWQQFRGLRKQHAHVRHYFEGHVKEHAKSSSQWTYEYLTTTEVIKAFQALDFAGQDVELSWKNRLRGCSIFALAPLTENPGQDLLHLREKMIHYEETRDQHRPSDRAAEAAIGLKVDVPTNRMELFRWMDSFTAYLSALFTDKCPLVTWTEAIAVKLQQRHAFHNYAQADWMCLLWRIHLGVRLFFQLKGSTADASDGLAILKQVVRDLSIHVKYGPDVLPQDMPRGSKAPAAATPSTRDGERRPQGDPDRASPERKKRRTERAERGPSMGAEFADTFAEDVARAISAAPEGNLRASTLWSSGADIRKLFGQAFLRLVPTGKEPCLKYFVFGNCTNPRCQNAHTVSATPSDNILKGIGSRVNTRVNTYISDSKE